MRSVKKIGIPAQVFMAWPGGVDLITHLANSLVLNPNFKLFVLVPDSTDHLNVRVEKDEQINPSLESFARHLLLRLYSPEVMKEQAQELKNGLDKKIKIVYYHNSKQGLITTIDALGLHAMIPTTASFGPGFPVAWVGYIWDLQHKHFPEFFSQEDITARNKIFNDTLKEAPSIIVNSQEVKNDASRFYKFERDKIVVLPFAPEPAKEWFDVDLAMIKKKYKLPSRYLLVSNQFWIHKSHITAIEAIAKLLNDRQYKNIHLVCTGKMEEPRKPEYIKQIKDMVTELGISKNVHFLGYIPKSEQIGIMRWALAVLQPTLFEGGRGGGAAHNAIALGVPLIVSDISINKELEGQNITFFKASSATDLSRKIKHVLKSPAEPQKKDDLIMRGHRNKLKLCKVLSRSISVAIKNYNNKVAKREPV